MNNRCRMLAALAIAFATSCSSGPPVKTTVSDSGLLQQRPCTMLAASPWIQKWFDAWELTSQEILRLPDAPPPTIVFYDSSCVYTTSAVTAGDIAPEDGPTLRGAKLPWRAAAHGDSITLPTASRIPVQLMSFTTTDRKTGPFFVMAAPSYWVKATGHVDDSGVTAVFLHEFTHTRQVGGFRDTLGPIDSTWAYPEELDDDAVQTHFGSDSVYVAAYLAERDLLFGAANADSLADVRALARQALAMIKDRQARWFVGDKAEFVQLDDIFLSLEGAAQWAAFAWLSHPDGGAMTRDAAIKKMIGKGRHWTQDEGLVLFLVVDRLLPDWPSLVFHEPSIGASDLLERAVRSQ
jgi:hypothetical protein